MNLDVRGNFTLKKRVCISPICHKLTREFVIQQESLIQLCGIDYIDHMMSFNTVKNQNTMDKSFLITCSNVLLGLLMFFTILKIMQSTFFSHLLCTYQNYYLNRFCHFFLNWFYTSLFSYMFFRIMLPLKERLSPKNENL